MRQVIEKALPLPSPDTLVMPSQRATERTPEMGIEEDGVNTNSSKGVDPRIPTRIVSAWRWES